MQITYQNSSLWQDGRRWPTRETPSCVVYCRAGSMGRSHLVSCRYVLAAHLAQSYALRMSRYPRRQFPRIIRADKPERSFCPQGLNVTEKRDTDNASLTPPWNHNGLWRFPRLFSWWSTSRMQPLTDFCLLSIVVSGRRTSGAAGSSYIFDLKSRKVFQSRWKIRT